MGTLDEVGALELLAPGADPVAVGILAMDLCSPWASERVGWRGQPDRRAPKDERRLLDLLDRVRDGLGEASPGFKSWLAYHHLAVPLSELDRHRPTWMQALPDDLMVPLPPTGTTDDTDARVVSLHSLASSTRLDIAGEPDPLEVLARWLVEASWSDCSAQQCRTLRVDWLGRGRQWWHRDQTERAVKNLLGTLSAPLQAVPDWSPPEPVDKHPTREEVHAELERQRIAWEARYAYNPAG